MSGLTLNDFCHHLVESDASGPNLSPADVAREFVDFFHLSNFPNMEELTAVLGRAGVRVAVCADVPGGLRGYHTGTKDGGYEIRVDISEWNGAQEHTVLHEAYEVVIERVSDLHPWIVAPQGKYKCRLADRFSAAVLMQPDRFTQIAETSGLDVIALHKEYGRAYSSVTMRLAEVMRSQPLMAILYEREDRIEHHFRTTATVASFRSLVVTRTSGFGVRHCIPLCGSRGGMPRWGMPPPPGSLAEGVALKGRPDYAEVEPGSGDVAVAARPVFWRGVLEKIVVVAVPYCDRSVLWPQFADAFFDSARRMAVATGPW